MVRDEMKQLHRDRAVPVSGHHGEEPQLHRPASGREPLIEIRQLGIEGKRPTPPHGEHGDDASIPHSDQVGIFRVKLIHEKTCRARCVLRDFLHERLIVEPMNLLKLVRRGGNFEYRGLLH